MKREISLERDAVTAERDVLVADVARNGDTRRIAIVDNGNEQIVIAEDHPAKSSIPDGGFGWVNSIVNSIVCLVTEWYVFLMSFLLVHVL